MESSVWLGVDVGKRSFHAALAVQMLGGNEWRKLPSAPFEHVVPSTAFLVTPVLRCNASPAAPAARAGQTCRRSHA